MPLLHPGWQHLSALARHLLLLILAHPNLMAGRRLREWPEGLARDMRVQPIRVKKALAELEGAGFVSVDGPLITLCPGSRPGQSLNYNNINKYINSSSPFISSDAAEEMAGQGEDGSSFSSPSSPSSPFILHDDQETGAGLAAGGFCGAASGSGTVPGAAADSRARRGACARGSCPMAAVSSCDRQAAAFPATSNAVINYSVCPDAYALSSSCPRQTRGHCAACGLPLQAAASMGIQARNMGADRIDASAGTESSRLEYAENPDSAESGASGKADKRRPKKGAAQKTVRNRAGESADRELASPPQVKKAARAPGNRQKKGSQEGNEQGASAEMPEMPERPYMPEGRAMRFLSSGGPVCINSGAVARWAEMYPDFDIDQEMAGLASWLASRPDKAPLPGVASMECYLANCLAKRWRRRKTRPKDAYDRLLDQIMESWQDPDLAAAQ